MEGIVVHSFDETIESMKIYLEQVDGTLILVGVCDDTVLREHTVDTLRKRLPPEITLRDFRYDPEHISLLEGALEATATNNGQPAVSVTGFEALSRDKRTEAIRLLNWERGRFGLTGIAVILWVNRATLAEIATKSADLTACSARNGMKMSSMRICTICPPRAGASPCRLTNSFWATSALR